MEKRGPGTIFTDPDEADREYLTAFSIEPMKKKELRQEPERAVILLSGGIDSATTLAIAKSRGYELYALSFDYHQRHKRELVSASQVASSLGVRKHLVTRFDLREIGGSALTSEIAVPKNRTRGGMSSAYHDMHVEPKLHAHPQIPVTYVPARNTIFLSFALAWAEVLNAGSIFIGANAVDYSGYPDCRPEYLTSFERTANRATKASVEGRVRFRIRAPLLSMKKAEIITTGASLGLDYALTWSCYDPQPKRERTEESRVKGRTTRNAEFKPQTYELVPCGRCDSCVFRAKGFEEAGIADPLLLK